MSNIAEFPDADSTVDSNKSARRSTTWWQQLENGHENSNDQFDIKELLKKTKPVKNIKLLRGGLLLATDIVALISACFISILISSFVRPYWGTNPELPLIPESRLIQFVMFVLPILLILGNSLRANIYGIFKPLWLETLDYLRIIFSSAAATTVVLFIVDGHFSRILFFTFWLTVLLVLPASRYMSKRFLLAIGCWFIPAAIFGIGKNAKRVSDAIAANKWLGLDVVAFIDTRKNGNKCTDVPVHSVIESMRDHRYYELKFGNPHFIFAPETQAEYEKYQSSLNHINSTSKSVTLSPPFYGLPLGGAEILHVPRCDSMFLNLNNNLMRPQNVLIKRCFDFFVSGMSIVLLSPLFMLAALLIKTDGGPVFFQQKRIGRYNTEFMCFKFRTMVPNSEEVLQNALMKNRSMRIEWETTHKLKNDPRITTIGKVLRKYSIDELPQLLNVFLNQMSLVGPRPIVDNEVDRYGEMLPYYLSTNPGITGLWQISGRSNTTYEERVELDVWYARNWSFWLDLVILVKTVPSVIIGKGAY